MNIRRLLVIALASAGAFAVSSAPSRAHCEHDRGEVASHVTYDYDLRDARPAVYYDNDGEAPLVYVDWRDRALHRHRRAWRQDGPQHWHPGYFPWQPGYRPRDGRRAGLYLYFGPGGSHYYTSGRFTGGCAWLHRRALASGSSYWWSRYNNCVR